MAGEWIAYDLALPDKPEVQELIDTTGLQVHEVVYNLLRLWGWASMHCSDGTARMTLPRLVRTCGADQEFWLAVASVGWLEIDETAATVAVPGWDRRFSQAAKSRAQHADRAAAQNERNPDRRRRAGVDCADAQPPAAPTRSRGEEIVPPPPPREASENGQAAEAAWLKLREAWNNGTGRPWKPVRPPDHAMERLLEPGWLDEALAAIQRLPRCKYFTTPVTLPQLCGKPGFARDVAGGKYDDVSKPRQRGGPDAPAPPKEFVGEDAEAFRRTLAKLAGGTT